MSEASPLAEHRERLLAALAGDLVGGGDDAPPAGLGHAERDRADADAACDRWAMASLSRFALHADEARAAHESDIELSISRILLSK